MFTGLIDALGTIERIERINAGVRLRIACPYEGLVLGESIAVSGVCLTVTSMEAGGFWADASQETLDKTMLGERKQGERVHLERALQSGARLGGHIVSGHVDGVGRLIGREALGDAQRVRFEVPDVLAPMLAPKGSVTIDGVSLTVNGATKSEFDVVLVPFTRSETLFDERREGAKVNIEVDVLAKYVARLLGKPGVDGVEPNNPGAAKGLTLETLRGSGYL